MKIRGWSKAGAGAAALLLVLGAAACGDDDEGTATTEPPSAEDTGGDAGSGGNGEAAAFCDPFFDTRGALSEIPEDPGEAGGHLEDEVLPKAQQLADSAEDEVAAPAATFAEGLEGGLDDVEALFGEFEEGELGDAFRELEMLAADGCGWERIEVDAVDFGYEGLPESLPAGKYAVVMTNVTEAGEQHEIGFVRPKEDTTETFDELLELPEDESMEKVDFVDAAFAPPGETGVVFLELEPGTYYYACFIPVGSGSEEPSEDAPPHFAAGMKGELTVD